jgi:hypothetical protein
MKLATPTALFVAKSITAWNNGSLPAAAFSTQTRYPASVSNGP